MKRKRTKWSAVPWTPFEPAVLPDNHPYTGLLAAPDAIYRNSRYQVIARAGSAPPPIGRYYNLSVHVHDRQPLHDWRDLQRIKNEIVGPEYEAVELYPAESRLVDTANEYTLFVFETWRPPFGYASRLVGGDGQVTGLARQRGWPGGERPADAIASLDVLIKELRRDE